MSGSFAPAKRATSTPIPVNRELMKTMTTTQICQATPIAAFLQAILNSHRRFFLSYAAPLLWNLAQVGLSIRPSPG